MIVTRSLIAACCVSLLWTENVVLSANVLGLFYMSSYSHFILGETLLKELASRGHQVTMVSPYPQKVPVENYRDIPVTEIFDIMKKRQEGRVLFDILKIPSFLFTFLYGSFGLELTDKTLSMKGFQTLINTTDTYDLVIMEQFFNEAHQGFAHHFNAPLIIFSTIGSNQWLNHYVGNPAPPSYAPFIYLNYSPYMTFFQRLINAFYIFSQDVYTHLYYLPMQNKLLQKYMPNSPHLSDIMYNVSLIFLNSHVSFKSPLPHMPNMIEIGGFHVKEAEKLPKDLQEFMDDAEDGVVLFSMGSNARSADLPIEKRESILKAFAKLKAKVLWKWENESLPGLPENVRQEKWIPQQSVLAHKNMKAIITHGGLLSIIEAIHRGVPLIGIPLFGDQKMNVADAVSNEYAIQINYEDLGEESLSAALKEIVENPKYSRNAQTRSRVLHDQPNKPLDTAVYWTEYVIRHRGAPHFKSAAVTLAWYQYLLLDVIAFATSMSVISSLVVCLSIKRCYRNRKNVKLKQK